MARPHTLLWEESGGTKCVCACACVCGRRPLCIVVSRLPRALRTQAFACARLDTDSEAPEAPNLCDLRLSNADTVGLTQNNPPLTSANVSTFQSRASGVPLLLDRGGSFKTKKSFLCPVFVTRRGRLWFRLLLSSAVVSALDLDPVEKAAPVVCNYKLRRWQLK